jgi:hypothetical protein
MSIEPKDVLYIAKVTGNDYDILTGITKEETDYLYLILNKHIELQNGDWDHETEDCLEILETMQDYWKKQIIQK